MDIPGAQGQDHIARPDKVQGRPGQPLPVGNKTHLGMTALAQRLVQLVSRNPVPRFLTGGVDLGQHDRIRIIKSGQKIVKQILSPRIPMGLKQRH